MMLYPQKAGKSVPIILKSGLPTGEESEKVVQNPLMLSFGQPSFMMKN